MEVINQGSLAKRWNVSSSCISQNIKKRNIRSKSTKCIPMEEVYRQEEWVKSGDYINYDKLTDYLEETHHINRSTLQTYFSKFNCMKKWMAGNYYTSKSVTLKMIQYYIGCETKAVFTHMMSVVE